MVTLMFMEDQTAKIKIYHLQFMLGIILKFTRLFWADIQSKMKILSDYEHLHSIMYHSALKRRRQKMYCSNTISVFCVSQTFLGQSVSSQTVVVLLRNPLLTPTATSRCVASVHSRSHLSSFCCIVRFCVKYTNCENHIFSPFQLLNRSNLKIEGIEIGLV